jgi:hypothetical protein
MLVVDQKREELKHLDLLLRLKATGPPRELAQTLKMSESSLYVLLKLAKKWGAKIIYNHSARTYEYEQPMLLKIGFFEIDE